jgi:PEP-CTERM motif-containing protein
VCAAVLLFGATASRADQFSFSYSGAGVTASGTLTATAVGLGIYDVTDISGTRNGTAISDSLAGGVFNYGSSTPLLTLTYDFNVNSILGIPVPTLDTVSYANGSYQEQTVGLTGTTTTKLSNFYIGHVPEPSTLLLLFTMGLGFWVLARKLPAKKTLRH